MRALATARNAQVQVESVDFWISELIASLWDNDVPSQLA
jgi:hypothetical protein